LVYIIVHDLDATKSVGQVRPKVKPLYLQSKILSQSLSLSLTLSLSVSLQCASPSATRVGGTPQPNDDDINRSRLSQSGLWVISHSRGVITFTYTRVSRRRRSLGFSRKPWLVRPANVTRFNARPETTIRYTCTSCLNSTCTTSRLSRRRFW